MSLSTQTYKQNKNFLITPSTMHEAMEYAKLISNSTFCPKEFKGKTGDVLVAMQMGAEIGLSPMQALQNIAVINGKPCLYGDAALAVVIAHPAYISHREWIEGDINAGTLIAYCAITRKNSEEYIKSFSMDEAKKAGLWSKPGVWQQYPKRMLQMRARSFCVRDKFADALRGMNIREEVEDYKIHVIKNNKTATMPNDVEIKAINNVDAEKTENKTIEHDIDQDLLDISWANDINELQNIYVGIYKYWVGKQDKENLAKIIDAKNKRKDEIENVVNAEIINTDTGEVK